MKHLANRFKGLRGSEAAIAVILPVLVIIHWRTSTAAVDWPFGISALLLVSYLLIQGAIYWHLKHRALTQATRLPSSFGLALGLLKKSNLILFGLFILALLSRAWTSGWNASLAWPQGLFAFAVLEYINYYHYQLVYDRRGSVRYLLHNRRLRRSALGTDLERHFSANEDKSPRSTVRR